MGKIKDIQRDVTDRWKKESLEDGCSNHWEIKINLATKEFFEFEVNGIG